MRMDRQTVRHVGVDSLFRNSANAPKHSCLKYTLHTRPSVAFLGLSYYILAYNRI
jgi:hypothetical protein